MAAIYRHARRLYIGTAAEMAAVAATLDVDGVGTKYWATDPPGALSIWNGTTWQGIGAGAVLHNTLSDLQGGQADQYYHTTSTQHTAVVAMVAAGLEALTSAEVDQLEAIGATTISAAQWGYLGVMDQSVATGASPSFTGLTVSGLGDGFVTASGGGVLSVVAEVALVLLGNYSQKAMIRGGTTDWETFSAATAGYAIVSTGVTPTFSLTPDWQGQHTFSAGISVVCIAGTADYNKFLVQDGNVVKYRTGAEVRSDIGAGTSSLVLGSTSTTAYRGDRGTLAYNHSIDNSQAHTDYLINNGNDATSGYLRAAYNTNVASGFGRAAIGYCGHSDYASFAHIDSNTTGGYAIVQSSGGQTYLNAASGAAIRFNINNGLEMLMDATRLTLSGVHLRMNDSKAIYLGTGDDFRLMHNGSHMYIDGYLHGANIYFRGEDAGGTQRQMVDLDPDSTTAGVILRCRGTATLYCGSGFTRSAFDHRVGGGLWVGSNNDPDDNDVHIDGSINKSTALGARAIRTIVQSLAHNTFTTLQFNSQIHDTDACFAPTNSAFYAKHNGYYIAVGGVGMLWSDVVGGKVVEFRAKYVDVGTATKILASTVIHTQASMGFEISVCSGMFYMSVNDYVQFDVYHNMGVAKNSRAATSTQNDYCFGSIVRIA